MANVQDFAKKYRSMGYTCAESTIRAANEAWDLGLGEDALRMLGGFGGGMHSGYVCGAISGGVAALSSRYNKKDGHSSPILSVKCKLFLNTVQERTGFLNCADLMPKYKTPEEGCDPTVVLITGILDEVEALKLDIPEQLDYDLRYPPEGKPGFDDFYNAAREQLKNAHSDVVLKETFGC